MTDTDTLREALESIKANCFRSDLSDHTALVGIALIAKEARTALQSGASK